MTKFVDALREIYGRGAVKPTRDHYFTRKGGKVFTGEACALGAAMIFCDPTAPQHWDLRASTPEFLQRVLKVTEEEAWTLVNKVPNINDKVVTQRILKDFEIKNPRPNYYEDFNLHFTIHQAWEEARNKYIDDNFLPTLYRVLEEEGMNEIEICPINEECG